MTQKLLSVSAIQDGTVIDHIPAGQAYKIIRLLQLTKHKKKVTVGINLPSQSMAYKDIIKVEQREISEKEASQIALFAPNATINIVKNYQLESKFKVKMPKVIEKVVICPNPKCITKHERMDSCFLVHAFGKKIQLQCKFCDKVFLEDQIDTH